MVGRTESGTVEERHGGLLDVRSIILGLLLLAGAIPARSQNDPLWPSGWKPIVIDKWGGLNLLNDTTMIDGDAQSAQNVLTDSGYLEKRPGNTRLATILPGSQVQYVNEWYAPTGQHFLIAQASKTVYQTDLSGSVVVLSTIQAGYNLSVVAGFSVLNFADGYEPIWYWNGESTGTVTDPVTGNEAPTCTYLAYKDARLWCANLPDGFTEVGDVSSGGGSSTVLVSSVGGNGYWAVPYNVSQVPDAPNRWDFNPDDGDQITCMAATPWGMYVGKRYSSFIVKGDDNSQYDPRLLDSKIGCIDNRSVQMVNGVLEWLSVDGVYGYDGQGTAQLLTRELDPLMQTVREASFSQEQFATQLQSDWASGTESTTTGNLPALPWDYNSIPDEIFPASSTLYDDNTNPLTEECSSNINPETGLPWNCGVGFSSDTLVNIDTTSAELSVGWAQSSVSSNGVVVWLSSFPAGNYTTTSTTWTLLGGFINPIGSTYNGIVSVVSSGRPGNSYGMELYTTANNNSYGPAGNAPSGNGWNFGYWSVAYEPAMLLNDSNLNISYWYGQCGTGGGNIECMEFNFIKNNVGNSWNGYGIQLYQSSCSSGGPPAGSGTCAFNLNLYKSVLGTKSNLGSAVVNYAASSSGSFDFNAIVLASTFSITRTPGGYFTVWDGTTPVINAFDNSINLKQSNAAELVQVGNEEQLPGDNYIGSFGYFFNPSLNGFGPGEIISRIYDTTSTVPLAGEMSSSYTLQGVNGQTAIDFYIRDSTSPNNDDWSAWQASSSNFLAVLPKRYWQYEALFTTSIASYTAQLSSIDIPAVTTGSYYSKVDYVGTLITQWLQFGVTEDNPGTYNYYVRQATYAFTGGNTSIPWLPQTADATVNLAVSTPTYVQFRLDSTPLATNPEGASAAEPIFGVFIRWDQGANLPVASETLQRRYMLCVTISTAATAPDTCLLRQKTGKWVEWTGPSVSAMGLYSDQMIAGDGGGSGYVWEILQPNIYSDDGAAINAQWIGADEVDGSVFLNKDYYGAMLDLQPVQYSSVTYSYAVQKSSGFVDQQIPLDNGMGLDTSLPVAGSEYGSMNTWVPPMAGYTVGRYIRVKIWDDQPNDYFRLNSYLLFVKPEPWTQPWGSP